MKVATAESANLAAESTRSDLRVDGELVVQRFYDIGYEIDLDRAFTLLGDRGPERLRPIRGEAQAIQIANPPVNVALGVEPVRIGDASLEADLSASVFEFGVVSLRARITLHGPQPWDHFVSLGTACANAPVWHELFPRLRAHLAERLAPAVARPGESPVTEDYVVFRVHRLTDASGSRLCTDLLGEEQVAALLLGESRPLATNTRREMLSQRFSYFEDDLTVLTWNSALVVEPVIEDADVQYVLEFANAQLLELRYYDSLLDQELPRMYDRIAEARHSFHLMGRRYSRLLSALQTRVAEATELVERTENALKVTDDVFLARIYAGALEVFRGRVWRKGVDDKLAIIRDAYSMLNAESQARRSEFLEIVIVVLILIELAVAILRR